MRGDRDPERIDDFVREARAGQLSRREVLARAGAAGFAASTLPMILAACGGSSTGTTASTTGSTAKPGGTMRVGMSFGAASTRDPHLAPPGTEDVMVNFNVFNLLYWYDAKGELIPALAESAEPNADATKWTLRLKSGVTFHDGSPLGADDVIYSFRRILDPKTKAEGAGSLVMIDAKKLRKVDDLTVEISLVYPFSILPYQFATKGVSIIKAGTTSFEKPNGTGPYKFASGTQQRVVLVKNENFWQPGRPYLDRVEIINVQDPTARLNGVRNGELDAIYPVDASQGAAVQNDSKVKVFVNKTGTYMPFLMNVAAKPFSDTRVRQALKLAADREAINRVAYNGGGYLGNDMFGYFDPGYPKDVAQRTYDPEQAASLWKAAGQDGTKLQLWVADIWPGQVNSGLAYAQQVKKAGIDLEIKKTPADQYFTKAYGVQPFTNEYWNYRPILTNWLEAFNKDSIYYRVAHYATPKTTAMFHDAAAQTDAAKRNEITGEMMRIFRDEGPYIVWAFEAAPDVYAKRIGGQENSAIRGLNGFHLEGFYVES